MIHIRDAEQVWAQPAEAKLTQMLLLMGLRDRADLILFDPDAEGLHIRYQVDNVLYDVVPPPLDLWPRMADYLRRHSSLIPSTRLHESMWTRLCGARTGRSAAGREIGWLSVQLLNCRLDISIRITPGAAGEHVRLEILAPYDVQEADTILSTVVARWGTAEGFLEFEYP